MEPNETIVIKGASDDLVEIKSGNSALAGEWDSLDQESVVVVHSTSGRIDTFGVVFDEDGIWRVSHTSVSGALTVDNVVCATLVDGPDESGGYADRCTVRGPIKSVERWAEWPPGIDELREFVDEAIADDATTDEQIRAMYAALRAT